jgi:hypothetical protein
MYAALQLSHSSLIRAQISGSTGFFAHSSSVVWTIAVVEDDGITASLDMDHELYAVQHMLKLGSGFAS